MLDFITKHFVVLTTVALGAGSAVCMLFLAAYLAIFDWNLIWLIEYTDIAKLFLIGTALVSSILGSVLIYAWSFLMWLKRGIKALRWVVFVLIVIAVAIDGHAIYADVKASNGQTAYHTTHLVATTSGLMMIYVLIGGPERWKQSPNQMVNILSDLSALVFTIAFLGWTYGLYVRDISKSTSQIVTKNETFASSKIIILLSHHVAFLSDRRVIVVPTADLVKIIAQTPN